MAHIIGHATGTVEIPGLTIPTRSGRHKAFDPSLQELMDIAENLGAQMALTYLAAAYANDMLGQITTTGLYMSIHSASPSTTGANELVAGTAYTAVSGGRPAIAWGTAASGVVTSNDTQTYAMLATESGGITYFGLWTAATSGTYLAGGTTSGLSGSIPSGASVTFTSAVTLTVAG